MTKIRLTIVSACLLLTTGAFAQTDAQKAEERRRSSEMMKPQTNQPAATGSGSAAQPMSAAEREAQQRRQSSEMMKPPTNPPAAAGKGSNAAPMSEADRKAAEARKKSEMMKPQ